MTFKTCPSAVSKTCNTPLELNLTAAGTFRPFTTTFISPVSTLRLTTSFLNHLGPYSLPSGPQSIPLSPQFGPKSFFMLLGSFIPKGSTSYNPSPKKHCATNNLPSSEKVIGLTPGPRFAAITFSP